MIVQEQKSSKKDMRRVAIGANTAQSRNTDRVGIVLLVLYFVFEYLRPQSFAPQLVVFRLPLILSLLLIYYTFRRIDREIYRDSLVKTYLAFLVCSAIGIVAAFNNYWPYQLTKYLMVYLFAVTLPMVIALSSSVQRLRRFIAIFVLINTMLAIISMQHGGMGPGSFLEDENDLALVLNMNIPFAYMLSQSPGGTWWKRWFYYLCFVILVLGVVHTLSRGGFLGLVVVIAGIFFYASHHRGKIIIGLLVLGAVVYTYMPPAYLKEIESISNESDGTRLDRFYLWNHAYHMFLDNPVLGVGAGNYPFRLDEYEKQAPGYNPETQTFRAGHVCHSLYFTLFSEYGTVGTVIYAILIVLLFRRMAVITRRLLNYATPNPEAMLLHKLTQASKISLAAFLVCALFISVLYYPPFWYLIGIVLTLDYASRHLIAMQEQKEPVTGEAS